MLLETYCIFYGVVGEINSWRCLASVRPSVVRRLGCTPRSGCGATRRRASMHRGRGEGEAVDGVLERGPDPAGVRLRGGHGAAASREGWARVGLPRRAASPCTAAPRAPRRIAAPLYRFGAASGPTSLKHPAAPLHPTRHPPTPKPCATPASSRASPSLSPPFLRATPARPCLALPGPWPPGPCCHVVQNNSSGAAGAGGARRWTRGGDLPRRRRPSAPSDAAEGRASRSSRRPLSDAACVASRHVPSRPWRVASVLERSPGTRPRRVAGGAQGGAQGVAASRGLAAPPLFMALPKCISARSGRRWRRSYTTAQTTLAPASSPASSVPGLVPGLPALRCGVLHGVLPVVALTRPGLTNRKILPLFSAAPPRAPPRASLMPILRGYRLDGNFLTRPDLVRARLAKFVLCCPPSSWRSVAWLGSSVLLRLPRCGAVTDRRRARAALPKWHSSGASRLEMALHCGAFARLSPFRPAPNGGSP